MNLLTLIKRNLRHFRRTHLGVVLGAAVSTAVLTGALLVGDSVRYSLRSIAEKRLGEVRLALDGKARPFRIDLADSLSQRLNAPVAPVLHLKGLLVEPESNRRVNRVEVLGVDERFWRLGGAENPFKEEKGIVLNEPLAKRLEVKPGDELLLRAERPGLLSGEAPLSREGDTNFSKRFKVRAVISDDQFGRFSLRANQAAPMNVFLPLKELGEKANLLLVGGDPGLEEAQKALARSFRLEDASLEVSELLSQNQVELRTERIFLDPETERAALTAAEDAQGVFTYFVNRIQAGERQTPYSLVAALDPKHPLIPLDMGEGEILINQWLADDLEAGPGDEVEVSYYVMGPGRKVEERSTSFSVRAVVPMEGPAADPELMPDFPGLNEGEDCSDWDPGMEIDLDRIRPADEEYWDRYRGTPKAYLTLKAGQALWTSRFGALTAVRYPATEGAVERISQAVLKALDLTALGLFFQPVHERAKNAGDQALDFGPLFLGLSFFLIAAALVLTAMLFSLGVEERTQEIGTLLALGFTRKKVRNLLLAEGLVLALLGAVLGMGLSLCYSRLMIFFLATLWSGAVAGSALFFHIQGTTLLLGGGIGTLMALVSIWWTLRQRAGMAVRYLMDGTREQPLMKRDKGGMGALVTAVAAIAAVLIILILCGEGSEVAAFFGAGALLLVAGMAMVHYLLCRRAKASKEAAMTLKGLGLRNSVRRRGRSLGVVCILACGCFLVFAVAANKKDPMKNARLPGAGTGGFSLIGEASLPILQDLATKEGCAAFGLDQTWEAVSIRVREGDDASCLNLNRAQIPTLLGISPERLKGRFTFVEVMQGFDGDDPWSLLTEKLPGGSVPAIADLGTIIWGLDKKVGDTLSLTDEQGRTFEVQLVGAIEHSILHGNLFISEEELLARYPSETGFKKVLVETPPGEEKKLSQALARAGRDQGLHMIPAVDRLAAFWAVENTYLTIFQMLGGFGLLLGSVGLAFVLLRNVMERRSELAMFRSVGFTRKSLRRMLLYEHMWLLITGMVCGIGAAAVAVWPALASMGSRLPWISLMVTLAVIMAGGLLWIQGAARLAMGREFIQALRNE